MVHLVAGVLRELHVEPVFAQPQQLDAVRALGFAKENLAADLSVEVLADAANLSPRQFSRVFREKTGQSPANAVERLRVEAARLMMETSRHPIEVIARETGFGDRERNARASSFPANQGLTRISQ